MEVVIGGWVTIMGAGWAMIKALGQDLTEEDRYSYYSFFYRVTSQLFTEIYLNCDFIQLYFPAIKYHRKCIMRTLS